MTGVFFILVAPVTILCAGYFAIYFTGPTNWDQSRKNAVKLLSLFAVFVGGYMCLVANTYCHLAKTEFKKLHISPYEGDYFAIQTLTTVGYGAHLCNCDLLADANTQPLTDEEKHSIRAEFHSLSNKAMMGWAMMWIVFGPLIYSYVRKIF